MPLESATFITDLVSTNPPGSDGLNQSDDHLRLIKAVLLAAFPGLNGAVNCTPAELNQLHTGTRTLGLANGSSGSPSVYFDSETGLGFYRGSAGHMTLPSGKRLNANGAVPVGSCQTCWPKDPGTTILARGGTATGTEEFIEPDGSVYNIATFPDLGAAYGSTFGGNGTTTFGVPDFKTTGKFLRSRTGSVAVGTAQSSVIKNHTHTATLSTDSQGAHSHTITITDPGHHHGVPVGAGAAGGTGFENTTAAPSVTPNTNDAFTGITASSNSTGAHTHTATGTTDNNASGDANETRPESFVCIYGCKT